MTIKQNVGYNMMYDEKRPAWETEVEKYLTNNENLSDGFFESDSGLGVLEGSIYPSSTQAAAGSMNEFEQIENWLEAAALEILTKYGTSQS